MEEGEENGIRGRGREESKCRRKPAHKSFPQSDTACAGVSSGVFFSLFPLSPLLAAAESAILQSEAQGQAPESGRAVRQAENCPHWRDQNSEEYSIVSNKITSSGNSFFDFSSL